MAFTLLPTPVMAASSTKTIKCGEAFTLEITDVYAVDSITGVSGDGVTTIYFVVIPNGAKVKLVKSIGGFFSYNVAPFNDITFLNKSPMHPNVEFACDYDDNINVEATVGSINTVVKNNEYYYVGGDSERNYGVRVFAVDDETLVQFGGPKPALKPQYTGNVLATPSKTQFIVKGKIKWTVEEPIPVTQVYNINQSNYLQLRAIATLLNRTVSQFDVGWDGQYAVIEPGKPFSSTVTGRKMQDTRNVRQSVTKFKMNGEVFSFKDAQLINGDINYIQLREFAQKLSGTASQFNVYWDERAKQAVIQPGVPYTGIKYVAPITVFEQYKGEEEILADGDYYMQIYGKFLYPVSGGQYWLELQSKIPDKPYKFKLVDNDKDSGPKYSIAYDGTYIMLPGSLEGVQLQSTTSATPHYWRINKYKSFITIRDYKNQKLMVNASGNKKSNNTLITGWTYTGSAPDHAKIVLYTEAVKDNLKTLMYIKDIPIKTTYKLGEGFDTAGLEVIINEGGVDINVNDKIKFYTSDTVELTQGRPFTTTGKKVVEIRYEGIRYGEFTVEVTK
jgi:hypothetical protein